MGEGEIELLSKGFARLIGSQVFTRLATFALNQIVTKTLSVEAFGLLAIRFHVINTSILMLSREGFRRGCLVSQREGRAASSVIQLSSLCIPLGAVFTIFGCWFFGGSNKGELLPGYEVAVLLQGAAAMVELLSEPLYILALVESKIGLRVTIEAAATLARILITVALLYARTFTEAVAISTAQVAYAVVLLLSYSWHYHGMIREFWDGSRTAPRDAKQKHQGGDDKIQKPKQCEGTAERNNDFKLCCNFSAQAVEKLLLAEGTKIAMSKVQSAYDQGIYGLVVNLGSIAARTILQPFEEASFMAFSQPDTGQQLEERRLRKLMPLIRIALLFGLLASSFGPSNTYLLLHILYGEKYSATEAPTALALYCPYILLLATNGILESFVQAVSRGPELKYGHIALIGITGVQTAATVGLVFNYGTLGMIAADGLGMVLRICYCTWFTVRYAKRNGMSLPSILREACPSSSTLAMLFCASISSAASLGVNFGRGWFTNLLPEMKIPFWTAASLHVGIEACLVLACIAVVMRSERSLLQIIRSDARRKVD